MIRFMIRPAILSNLYQSSYLQLPKLLRPFSCSLSHQQSKESPIKSTDLLYTIQGPSFTSLNLVSPTSRSFYTMNVSMSKNKEESINNQQPTSDINPNEGTESIKSDSGQPDPKDRKGRYKALIRDYGLTAVVFHVTISLASLGICYLLVNSSIPMDKIFTWLGISDKLGNMTDAASTSTNFVVAYALHKSFALVRLSITAACVPVIVRYLRSKGFTKPVASAVKKAN